MIHLRTRYLYGSARRRVPGLGREISRRKYCRALSSCGWIYPGEAKFEWATTPRLCGSLRLANEIRSDEVLVTRAAAPERAIRAGTPTQLDISMNFAATPLRAEFTSSPARSYRVR